MTKHRAEAERLAVELADERDFSGGLLQELGRSDAMLMMLARAVVACDVEVMRGMARDLLAPGQRETVKALQTEQGAKLTGWPISLLAGAMVEHLDFIEAANYCTMNVTVPPKDGQGEPRYLALTAQWRGGKTPCDVIAELTAERDALLARAAAVEGATSE